MDKRNGFQKALTGARIVFVLLVTCSLLAGCGGRQAPSAEQAFPSRALTYLIPFDPGGQADRLARQQVPALKSNLGQDIVVDYKVGGGGALAWAEVTRAKADGYTVVATSLPHIVLQPMFGKVDYKTDQLDCLVTFARTPTALAVLKTGPFDTLDKFLAAARERPGAITIGGVGEFTPHHMAVLKLQKLAGIKVKYVSYTGAAPQITAFTGAKVDAVIGNLDDLIRNKGDVNVLALADTNRSADFPDVRTFTELGYDLVEPIDRGVAVPAGTPEAVAKKLEAAFMQIARDPGSQAALKQQGFVPLAMGRAETKSHIQKMVEIYKQLADLVK